LSVFRRRREAESSEADDYQDLDDFDEETAAEPDDASGPPTESARPSGPWDFHDVSDDDEVPRVDLGSLLMPVPDGLEVRVEVQDDVPVAATLVDGGSALQVHAFAAPKSSGLWAEVRNEIVQSLREAGGSADDATGPFGAELRARIPVETGGTQPARFLGVDGPRWFLRGMLTGPGSTDQQQARRLEAAFRQVVVNRGTEAMAPRDMLPLHLPREAHDAQPHPPEPDRSLQLPERGPEITEIQ
jgi:hypothetical protein